MFLSDYLNPENFPNRVRNLPKTLKEFPDWKTGLNKAIKLYEKGQAFSPSFAFHATGEQLTHALFQLIQQYGKNRGGNELNEKLIRKWFEDGIYTELLQEFPLALLQEFTLADFTSLQEVLMLPSHHHRAALFLYCYWMMPEEKYKIWIKENIACRVFDGGKGNCRFIEVYCGFDNMTKQPKSGMLNNSDLVAGRIVSVETFHNGNSGRLGRILSTPAREFMMKTKGCLQNTLSVIFAANKKNRIKADGTSENLLASHSSIYSCRGGSKAAKHIKIPHIGHEHDLVVTDVLLQEVANAIEDYMAFRSAFHEEMHQAKTTQDISTHKLVFDKYRINFFTYYIQDRIVFQKLPSAQRVAERLCYYVNSPIEDGNKTTVAETIHYLWNGTAEDQDERCRLLNDKLNKRKPSLK